MLTVELETSTVNTKTSALSFKACDGNVAGHELIDAHFLFIVSKLTPPPFSLKAPSSLALRHL